MRVESFISRPRMKCHIYLFMQLFIHRRQINARRAYSSRRDRAEVRASGKLVSFNSQFLSRSATRAGRRELQKMFRRSILASLMCLRRLIQFEPKVDDEVVSCEAGISKRIQTDLTFSIRRNRIGCNARGLSRSSCL